MQKLVKTSILFILSIGLCFLFLSCEPQMDPGSALSQSAEENSAVFNLDEKALLASPGVTVVSEETSITPPLLKLTGSVKKVVVNPGTKGEYSYFLLIISQPYPTTSSIIAPRSVILFNKEGRSEGFDRYIGLPVVVVGYMGAGTIGYTTQLVRGLIVVEISLQTPYISDEGVIRYISLEGGFYGIIGTKGNYDPVNLPREFMQDGLRVRFVARLLDSWASIHMWGRLIEIIKIEKIDNSIYVNLDEKFMLQTGQAAIVKTEELTFTFVEVLADSRCPRDVECIWAGEAVISVKVNIKGQEYGPFKMTTRDYPSVLQVEGYSVFFVDLLPYPISTTPRPQEPYQGIFYITRTPVIYTK
jgi:hypothetical protein